MSKNTGVLLIGLLFMTAVYNIEAAGKHLQCWHCSSDTIGSESFCDIDFKENNIPTDLLKERNINVIRSCNSIIDSDHQHAVCRKTVEDTNGKIVTKRFCYYTNKSDSIDYCNTEVTEKNVQRKFCQDCLTDKCNSAAQVTGIVILMAIPTFYSCIVVL